MALPVLAASLVGLGLSGCLSPTLPLPPPSKPNISAPSDSGEIQITGVVQSRATVFARNLRSDEIVGQVTGESGRYDMTMSAEEGDVISVWQSINTETSATVEVVVPGEDPTDANVIPEPPMGGSSGE